ncbi:MAG: SusD/RagB family nutrient-binding outer membrane lipoprotein [Bacteroidaceae bacterium]|nr:SusD/RagB family nutrient-binding outer membrane lipoprotein [Bacteroidaceae bacterium]
MVKIKYLILAVAALFSATSCDDYLNINTDPDNPSNTIAPVETRLPWIQHHYLYAQMAAGYRASCITQETTSVWRTTRDGSSAQWSGSSSMSTTPYQWWFVVAACNFKDLYEKAEEEGAYHYMGTVKALRAAGFMLMADWYGEMPYTEALGSSVTPKFDSGKTIFMGCLEEIDEAIELFKKTQEAGATPLSKGDSWNGGDTDKWIRMCYGLKARWLNNLSKKSDLYDPAAILDAVSKGPQNNDQSTIVHHVDNAEDNVGDIMWGDPLMASIVFDCCGMSTNRRITKYYTDLLTDFDDQAIEDPRADKLIPFAQVGTDKHWMRSQGVDMTSGIRINDAGPYPTAYNDGTSTITLTDEAAGITRVVNPGEWYCNTTNSARWGDSIYVSFRSGAIGYYNTVDDQYRAKDNTVMGSGTFYTRPDGPTHFLCYHEMCFIKAEVLFKQGDKAGAFTAYKNGVKAHMELMNEKLADYGSSDPSKSVMLQSDIDNYVNTALGTSANLTLGKIMEQKYIALSFMQQNWNDMRRYDYGERDNAYPHFSVPYEFALNPNAQKTMTGGKAWGSYRRIRQSEHEMNYNASSLDASHAHARDENIYGYPVWFDCETDAQYEETRK